MIKISKNNSGIILFAVLWIMVILSLLAIGLGRQTHIELTLAKYFNAKIQSKYMAYSGLTYAIDLVKKDNMNKDLGKRDVFNPAVYSKTIQLGSGYFKVIELQDEASKININAITPTNYQILTNLLMQVGVDEQTSLTIASSVVDWTDTDNTTFNPPYGAEEDYYQRVGYSCKNQAFDSIQEITLVQGMNKNIFQKIKDFITIDPVQGPLLINLDTASQEVLRAFAKSFTGPQTNTSLEDADSLVNNIMEYRKSKDSPNESAQDRAIEANKMNLNSKESAIFLMMQAQRQRIPEYIHIHVQGIEPTTKASTDLTATLQRSDYSFLRWHRN